MRTFWIVLAFACFVSPLWVHAADMPAAQSVEEPDAPDEDSDKEMNANQVPGQTEQTVKPAQQVSSPAPDKPAAPTPLEGDTNYDRVILQGLNKVTARAQEIDAPIGSVVRFGTIEIVAHSCWKAAPDERPENAALLEISEIKQGEAPTQIFLGWMFASSPGLSALEHPFYDISVVKCEKAVAVAPQAPAVAPKTLKKKSS